MDQNNEILIGLFVNHRRRWLANVDSMLPDRELNSDEVAKWQADYEALRNKAAQSLAEARFCNPKICGNPPAGFPEMIFLPQAGFEEGLAGLRNAGRLDGKHGGQDG